MKPLLASLLTLTFLSCTSTKQPTASKPSTQSAWRSLFNGQDLTGWKVTGTARWLADNKDGSIPMIVGSQEGDPKHAGNLVTTDQFQNFELELDFMIDEHGKYNSGVYLRNPPPGTPGGKNGYQVNIGRGAAGEYCGGLVITDDKGTPIWLAKGDETDTIRIPRDWNSMSIRADGAHIIVYLNRHKVVDFTDPNPDPRFLQKGVLALQTYGAEGHAGWVKFRNIRIHELP